MMRKFIVCAPVATPAVLGLFQRCSVVGPTIIVDEDHPRSRIEIRKVPNTWRDLIRRDPRLGDAFESANELLFPVRETSYAHLSEPTSQKLTTLSKLHTPVPIRRYKAVQELWQEGKIDSEDAFVAAMDTLSDIQHDIAEAVGFMALITSEFVSLSAALKFLTVELENSEHIGYTDSLAAFVEFAMSKDGGANAHLVREFIEREVIEKKNPAATMIYAVIADFFVHSVILTTRKQGEGVGTRSVVTLFSELSKLLGEVHTLNILSNVMNIAGALLFEVDQQMRVQSTEEADEHLREQLLPLIVIHKALQSMKVLQRVDVKAEFRSLFHLFNALHISKRLTESHQVGTRLASCFEAHRAKLLPEDEDRYRVTLFQMCQDMCMSRRPSSARFLHSVIEKVPDASVPWRFLALDLMKQKRFDDALIAVKKAISLNPLDDYSLLVLVQIYEELGRPLLRQAALELASAAAHIKARESNEEGREESEKKTISDAVQAIDESTYPDIDPKEEHPEYKDYLEKMRAHHIYANQSKRKPRVQSRPLSDRIFESNPEVASLPGMGPKQTDAFLDSDPVLTDGGYSNAASSKIKGSSMK